MATTVNHRDRPVPALLRPEEVAEILQVTPRTVRRWGANGVIERVRLGDRLTRYTRDSVEALIHPHNHRSAVVSGASAKTGEATPSAES